ncbi:MAG: hypothetical protein ACPGSI_04520 [Pikeienuella sp.]
MRRIFLSLFAICIALGLGADISHADDARAETAIGNLRELIANRTPLMAELDELLKEPVEDAAEAGAARKAVIADLRAELTELDEQIGAVATGVSEAEFRTQSSGFDLNTELQALVEPFVAIMRDATENARQIERLRRSLGEARRREALALRALKTLKRVREKAVDPVVIGQLDAMAETWAKRADAAADLANALDQQMRDRIADQGESRASANAAASGFFRERGVSLLLGVSAFAFVFLGLRFVHRGAVWLRVRRGVQRSFSTRLVNLVFSVLTIVLAVGAMLAVFNLRNDWLLLGVFGVMLLALGWVGIKMLPGAIEQVTLLLNLGAVQEDERVLIEGIPYRVRKLDFYTDFENPLLEGADYTLPVRELIGRHSRPSGKHEPWFPTRRGDWVRLADETFGQIVSQSPEMVEIEIPGGSHMTYATADFLAEKPENLSHGYRAEITFGIAYDHQTEATGPLVAALISHVKAGLLAMLPADQLRDVGCEMLDAGDNAIIYEVEADLTGAAASRCEDVERALTRLCVEACTVNGWNIPYPQMVVHKA